MPVSPDLAGTAEGNLVQHREIVLNHGGLADDHRRRVIEHDALTDPRRGVDVDGELLGDPALQVERQLHALLRPVVMRDAVALQGVKALEVQQWGGVSAGGGITADDRP